MPGALSSLHVLVVDCQASGATPAHGDLLELGWGVTSAAADVVPAEASWVKPLTTRRVSRAVRELTGWSERALETSVEPLAAWDRLRAVAPLPIPVPTVIHFARFELPFLRQLHVAGGGAEGELPLDVVCLHAIACRLFPTLPRRNLRALAGHLGGSADMIRRAKGHVEATAFVWRAMVPLLEREGVKHWADLAPWLRDTPAPSSRASSPRQFPLSVVRRRSLPDVPGVYRFLRPNGDVLYVGKASSLKRRVASHFTAARGSRTTERALEMLSQAHDIDVTPQATSLEAALLEVDEIKRLDPPYNVHLRGAVRGADRSAWFASRDWSHTVSAPDEAHRVGPLPSRFSVAGIASMHAMLLGEPPTPRHRANAVGVPAAFGPEAALFDAAWAKFVDEELAGTGSVRTRILEASARIVPRERPEDETEDAPAGWDEETVRRYLERVITTEGTLVRRARVLALLSDAHVIFREPGDAAARLLVLANGEIASRFALAEHAAAAPGAPPSRLSRLAAFDASRYDRLRVLATELRRVRTQGGDVEVCVGAHRLSSLMRLDYHRDRSM